MAEEPSHATLVIVEVSLTGKETKTRPNLTFTAASKGGKTIFINKTSEMFLIEEGQTKLYVPFFLSDTGCAPFSLSAKIAEKKSPGKVLSSMKKVIPFACGE